MRGPLKWSRTATSLLAGCGALVALVAFAPTPALAKSPGVNGQIAYDLGGNGVVTANPDGGGAVVLVPGTCCGDWSPHGNKLVVPYGTDDGRIGTATVNADGSGYTPFPIGDPTLNVGCGTGSWSPDGKLLACESWDDSNPARNGIYTISASDGSRLTRVTSNPSGGGHDIPGSWSPDGQRIVFTRHDANGDSVGLFIVKTNTGQVQEIAADPLLNLTPDWSPQGNAIIFSRHVSHDARGSIWVIHADGTGLREINVPGLACGGANADPNGVGCHGVRWSPDGQKIIFAATKPESGRNIYTASSDGGDLTQVSFDGFDDDPAWGTHK
jgi:dipeptidyl aminopeptidase/acylaminoacyl peptidase